MSTKAKKLLLNKVNDMNDIAKKEKTDVVAFDNSVFLEDADTAAENMTADSFQIPRVYLLQQMSNAVQKGGDDYIEGAEAGKILESASQTIYDGEKGITFVPAYYERTWVEYGNDGKKFERDHGTDLSVVDGGKHVGKTYEFPVDNGNLIRETGNYYGLLVDDAGANPAVLGMSKTNLTSSKQFNMMMARLRVPHPKNKGETFNPASFWNAYTLTTQPKKWDEGTSYIYKVAPMFDANSGGVVANLPNGGEIYMKAKALREDIKQGAAKASEDVM